MSGIVGSKDNIRGSGIVGKLGTDGQIMTSAGAGVSAVYEDAAAGGTSWQSVVTASTLAAASGNGYPINTTSNACTVTLPGSPSVGDTIEFTDYARNWGTNAMTFNLNSLKYQGQTSPVPVYDTNGESISITYVDATKGWIPTTDGSVVDEVPQTYSADWLVLAGGGGGGGGGSGGGGGAGGYRGSYASENTGGGAGSEPALSFSPGTVYTVTVGGAGTAGTMAGSPDVDGGQGGVSSITGSDITDITTVGGGGGNTLGPDQSVFDGGSGGGSNGGSSSYTNIGSGTSGQGYDGGNGQSNGWSGGGGGGAAAAGGAGSGSTTSAVSGPGGAGIDGSITGSAVGRGGGGSGGDYATPGPIGTATHGGAVGGLANNNGIAAAAYLGGGGGGGAGPSSAQNGGAGGSGVVIIRLPTASYSGTNSNAETPTTDGSDTILQFNSTGSLTG